MMMEQGAYDMVFHFGVEVEKGDEKMLEAEPHLEQMTRQVQNLLN